MIVADTNLIAYLTNNLMLKAFTFSQSVGITINLFDVFSSELLAQRIRGCLKSIRLCQSS